MGYFKLNDIAKCVMTSWIIKKAGYKVVYKTTIGNYVKIIYQFRYWTIQEIAEDIVFNKESNDWDAVEIKDVLEGELKR